MTAIFDPDTGDLTFSTYLGGSSSDEFWGLETAPGGLAFVAGLTYSSDIPTEMPYQDSLKAYEDGWVVFWDTLPPEVSTVSPPADSTDAATDTTVEAVFNERLDPATLTTDSFTLVASSERPHVSGTVTYDDSLKKAVFTPSAALDGNTTYTATLTAAIADVSGHNLETDYSWSFTTVADETPTAVSQTFSVAAGTTVADYRIISIPLLPSDGSPEAAIGSQIGQYDTRMMKIGYWSTDSQAYKEYPFVDEDDLVPGDAAWFLFRNGASLTFTGTATELVEGPPGVYGYEYHLDSGWNMVGNPFQRQISLSNMYVAEDGSSTYQALSSTANTITQRVFWRFNGTYTSATALAVGQGGWVKKLTTGGGKLFFAYPASSAVAADVAPSAVSDDLERPPAPPADVMDSGTSSGGGGGGCFISGAVVSPGR